MKTHNSNVENGWGTLTKNTQTHKKLYLLFIGLWGPEKQGTYVCVFCLFSFFDVGVVVCLCFVWHVTVREERMGGWPLVIFLFMHTPRTKRTDGWFWLIDISSQSYPRC